ncbi:tyrosine-type recombinase/integrase [Ureibacillus aquaedulcis]|uniref:Tyrosine-type recombinase/integrase n=1 Tax=Ureibacillus aquaedulcis TaxID=3058421 RepID=A0ABT8GP23_9BACL|nr:tyrosine-type recombinase/integrase [Ureibacillus sp. BA0131]MDN4493099.1 tyrosine-type recombinase/integrase [Ureibacillus sp. BA0131]
MTKITEYMKKGKKHFMFKVYLGKNPIDGEERSTTRRGFKSKKEAELALMKLKLAAANGDYLQPAHKKFNEVYNLWLDEEYKNSVEESTLKKTKTIFKIHVIPKIGDRDIKKINRTLCKTLIKEWSDSVKHARVIRSYVSRVFDFAISNDYVKDNPFNGLKVSRQIEKYDLEEELESEDSIEDIDFYNYEELINFLDAIENETDIKIKTFYRLLVFSGMRKGEAFALTWGDINFKTNEIKITKALTKGEERPLYIKKTKNGIKRCIVMDEETMNMLKNWKQIQSEQYKILGFEISRKKQLVFSNNDNKFIQPSKTFEWMKGICEKNNLRYLNTHGLRHTHCSLLFEAGVSVKEVQIRLGHKDIKTTLNIYTHLSQKSKINTVQTFKDFLDSKKH